MHRKDLEKTLVLIKPDALKNSLTGYILSQLSGFHTGLHFAAAKVVLVNRILAEEHYAEHVGKFFYPSLLEYITGCLHYPDQPWKRRVIAIIYQGPNAIRMIREIVGPTNPHDAREKQPGTIRSLGSVIPVQDETGKVIGDRSDNLIHASANMDDAEREIKLWFMPADIPPLMRNYPSEVVNEFYYFKDDSLYTEYEPGRICICAPGDLMWSSDLEAIHLLIKGQQAHCTVNAVVAKYLINIDEFSK
ncbi:MAG TPA: nucleoside-diphosphate kinase [Deltaproteobacteria bacterium]|nr:nucleoside-diphosphate kinase [Deltaproteobacteria bacterium]